MEPVKMKSGKNYLARVIACQAVTLILLLTVLFWARGLCQKLLWNVEWYSLGRSGPSGNMPLHLEPSGLSDGLTNAPRDEVNPSLAYASANPSDISVLLSGFFSDLKLQPYLAKKGIIISQSDRNASPTTVSQREKNNEWITVSYDATSGRLIRCRVEIKVENHEMNRQILGYAGPGGVNEDANADVGRFQSPVIGKSSKYKCIIVYDCGSRQFYELDFENREVRHGNEISKGHSDPVQIGRIEKNPNALVCSWLPERLKKKSEESELSPAQEKKGKSFIPTPDILLVLDAQCGIEYLDRKTLDLIGPAGRLVFPQKYSVGETFRPDNALAYLTDLCFYEGDYLGMLVGTLSGDGLAVQLTVFDKNGKAVRGVQEIRNSADQPAGPLLLVCKFILESLHPPVLSMASVGAAGRGEAAVGHQAMFILPYSFAGLIGYYDRDRSLNKMIPQAIGILLPGVAFGLYLAWRVARDARAVGLAPKTRTAWFWVTWALGLSAYITYRLTRPRDVLVTCPNCGKLRRPDQVQCHHCSAPWHIPDLTPPEWRVVQKIENS
jgi:hypothetical protein